MERTPVQDPDPLTDDATTTVAPVAAEGALSDPPATAGEPVIVTDKLSKTFSFGGRQQHVLKNLDLTIHRGELAVIMGPSGSGKSTLLYALSGMDRPTLGTVTFAGQQISSHDEDELAKFRRHHCGFIFQQSHLLDSMSVMDNVMAVGLLGGEPRREVAKRATGLFDLVALTREDTRKFSTMLSGGEAQRAAIVRGLVNTPDVLFADEPTGQLNSEYAARVLDLLTEVNADGQTIVMVTHDLRTAIRGSRILYLRDGAIQGELQLGPWAGASDDRHHRLVEFLDGLGW